MRVVGRRPPDSRLRGNDGAACGANDVDRRTSDAGPSCRSKTFPRSSPVDSTGIGVQCIMSTR